MKKKIMILVLFLFLIGGQITVAAQKKLTLTEDTELIYALTQKGQSLRAEDFKSIIEQQHSLNIKEISFSNNGRANTINSGLMKADLTFTDENGDLYQEKLPYLVKTKTPTIFIESINYHKNSKRLTVQTSDSSASLYLITDTKNYLCPVDDNGMFEGKFNPHELPETVYLFALDKEGHYSDISSFSLKENEIIKEKSEVPMDETFINTLLNTEDQLTPLRADRTRNTVVILIVIGIISIILVTSIYFFAHKRQN